MSFLRFAIGANYGRFLRSLKEIAARDERHSQLGLLMDFGGCFLRYGCGLSDYLNYELWNKPAGERREYVTIKDMDAFYARVSPDAYKNFFSIKPDFLRNFAPYIHRTFYVPQEGNLPELEEFLRSHTEVMVKPVNGLAGRGVRKQKTAEITDPAAWHKKLMEEELFLEELIVQHPELDELAPNSVNTIRVMTVRAGEESVILFACLRVGNGSADVDNFHAGGMAVQVNVNTGVLEGDAVDKGGKWFVRHPVTGVKFDGRPLPLWGEVRRICLEAAAVNPHIHVVGWDVAITPDGPTFVEGNRRPGFDLPQMTGRRGRRDILRRVDELLERTGEK